jgi:glycosyltransferase involved in cell wall biosynthesis
MHDSTGKVPRILVFAYACQPDKGSEPGAGWAIVHALAQVAECTVLVGSEHVEALRRWEASATNGRPLFVEVQEPGWGRHAKYHRITWFLLYLEWLRRAHRKATYLHREQAFDLAYHATYSVFWLPSPATRLGIPSVWGPVGGAVTTPRPLWRALGTRGIAGEVLDATAVRLLKWLPATRRTWHAATVRLAQNEETLGSLPGSLRGATHVLNHATLIGVPPTEGGPPGRHFLSVGPLEARKGVGLSIRALRHAPSDVSLVIVGDGPQRRALERLAARLGLARRVIFRGSVPRYEVFALWQGAAGAVFSGLREEGGLSLAEAMLCGVPVIVLAHGGARTVAQAAIDASRVAQIPPGSLESVVRAIGRAMARFVEQPPWDRRSNIDVAAQRRRLQRTVLGALAAGAERSVRQSR